MLSAILGVEAKWKVQRMHAPSTVIVRLLSIGGFESSRTWLYASCSLRCDATLSRYYAPF